MFDQLVLSNFRQHENLTIDFESGLVAIRGANEAGKTTLQEAIAYALFGANALREAFAAVVRWGQPEASLCVTLRLTLDGVQYQIVRKKSGAELVAQGLPGDNDLLVTGQTEVTKYVERLLRVDAATAGKMMLASQGKLRGALEERGKALELISELANFDLIDRIITLVQTKLPGGNTKAAEERLKNLREQTVEVPALDMSEQEARAEAINTQLGQKHADSAATAAALSEQNAVKAREQIGAASAAERKLADLEARVEAARIAAAVVPTEPAHTQVDIDRWRAEMATEKAQTVLHQIWMHLKGLKRPDVDWEGSRASFEEFFTAAKVKEAAALKAMQAAEVERAAKRAQLINDKICGLCGKDLTDVPEVVAKNTELQAAIAALDAVVTAQAVNAMAASEERGELATVQAQASKYELALSRYLDHVDLFDDHYPPRWVWKGEPPKPPAANIVDTDALIRTAENALRAFATAQGAQTAAQGVLTQLSAELMAFRPVCAQAQAAVEPAKTVLQEAATLQARVAAIGAEITQLQFDAKQTAQEIAHAQEIHAERLRAAQLVKDQADKAQYDLEQMNRGNALAVKLRNARPQIADKLWGIVLAAVSKYFSDVRGTQSVVTRSDNDFLVDGKPTPGLSGSTLDSLGLGMRVALTKTFMPWIPVMMLDEPAAACDDEREINMLGMIVAAGFDQVILVTHSAHADAFANQVVQL